MFPGGVERDQWHESSFNASVFCYSFEKTANTAMS